MVELGAQRAIFSIIIVPSPHLVRHGTVGLVTWTTFYIYGSQKLYVTKAHMNMILFWGRNVAFWRLPHVLYTSNFRLMKMPKKRPKSLLLLKTSYASLM